MFLVHFSVICIYFVENEFSTMRNEKAFNKLYDDYWSQLYTFAYNILRNKENVEDIIQEVFFDLWNRFDEVQINNHKAYLYKAVKFQCAKKLKTHKFSEVQIEKIEYALALFDTIPSELGNTKKELIDKVESKAKEILPEKCLQIFKLRYQDNLTYKEIASKLNISISTVDNQLFKAVRLLRSSNIYYEEIIALAIFLSVQ